MMKFAKVALMLLVLVLGTQLAFELQKIGFTSTASVIALITAAVVGYPIAKRKKAMEDSDGAR